MSTEIILMPDYAFIVDNMLQESPILYTTNKVM